MSRLILLRAVLDLFDGSGGAAAGGEGGAAAGAISGADMTSSAAGKKAKGEYANVVFGKQPDAQEADDTAQAATGDADQQGAQSERTPFKDLINGEYKEDFDKIFNRRFKDYKELQQRASDQQGVLDVLMAKYGITDGNLESLSKAIEDDDAMWAEAADEAGMSLDQYKQFQKLSRENARLMRETQARAEMEEAQAREERLMADAEQVKLAFPDFDLATEIAGSVDPVTGRSRFVELLSAGIDMETAYKTIHFNELMTGAIKQTAQTAEKKITDNIRAKGMRPIENGTTSQSAFTYKTDPRTFTRKDRAEVVRRAARGEQIIF